MPSRTLQYLGHEGNHEHLDQPLFTRYNGTNFIYAYKITAHL